MPLSRDQRRAMTRSVARMNARQAERATVPVPGPDTGPLPRPAPSPEARTAVAARMWWAAQARPDQAERLMAARAVVLGQ